MVVGQVWPSACGGAEGHAEAVKPAPPPIHIDAAACNARMWQRDGHRAQHGDIAKRKANDRAAALAVAVTALLADGAVMTRRQVQEATNAGVQSLDRALADLVQAGVVLRKRKGLTFVYWRTT